MRYEIFTKKILISDVLGQVSLTDIMCVRQTKNLFFKKSSLIGLSKSMLK